LPDYYLRIGVQNLIKLEKIDNADPTFRDNATFYLRLGLIEKTLVSFESVNQKDYFIR